MENLLAMFSVFFKDSTKNGLQKHLPLISRNMAFSGRVCFFFFCHLQPVSIWVWTCLHGGLELLKLIKLGILVVKRGIVFPTFGFFYFCCPKDHWTLKTGYFEDLTPAIQVQTLPLEGPRSLGWNEISFILGRCSSFITKPAIENPQR